MRSDVNMNQYLSNPGARLRSNLEHDEQQLSVVIDCKPGTAWDRDLINPHSVLHMHDRECLRYLFRAMSDNLRLIELLHCSMNSRLELPADSELRAVLLSWASPSRKVDKQ